MALYPCQIAFVALFATLAAGCGVTSPDPTPVAHSEVFPTNTGVPDPWAIGTVVVGYEESICSGTLIGPKVVATAAHCCNRSGITQAAVVLENGQFRLVSGHCIPHPRSNPQPIAEQNSRPEAARPIPMIRTDRGWIPDDPSTQDQQFDVAVMILQAPVHDILPAPLALTQPPLYAPQYLVGFGAEALIPCSENPNASGLPRLQLGTECYQAIGVGVRRGGEAEIIGKIANDRVQIVSGATTALPGDSGGTGLTWYSDGSFAVTSILSGAFFDTNRQFINVNINVAIDSGPGQWILATADQYRAYVAVY